MEAHLELKLVRDCKSVMDEHEVWKQRFCNLVVSAASFC